MGFEKAAGGSVELGERERREQLIAARALSLRKGDGGLEGVFGRGGVRRIALRQDIAARPMKLAFERAVARALARRQSFVENGQRAFRIVGARLGIGQRDLDDPGNAARFVRNCTLSRFV